MDDGTIVNVEWVQPSYWSCDVLINYRTDNLKTTKLSEHELEQILQKCHSEAYGGHHA